MVTKIIQISILLIIFLTGIVYASGKITHLKGEAILKRDGLEMDASSGMILQCNDVLIGKSEETYAKFTFYDNNFKLEGIEDWEISCKKSTSGKVKYIKGKAFINRGIKKYPLTKNSKIYLGDIITSQEDSKVKISLDNGRIISLNGKSRLKIEENAGKKTIKTHFVDFAKSIKNWFRNLIKGENFEIKTTTAGTGSRG